MKFTDFCEPKIKKLKNILQSLANPYFLNPLLMRAPRIFHRKAKPKVTRIPLLASYKKRNAKYKQHLAWFHSNEK